MIYYSDLPQESGLKKLSTVRVAAAWYPAVIFPRNSKPTAAVSVEELGSRPSPKLSTEKKKNKFSRRDTLELFGEAHSYLYYFAFPFAPE